eukprot:CAMPEP_0174310168 /NCGR_PEP_ID=MMETSP0810-20121108/2875_1 /TAXON_ID=73025 ORGANISM="Eutreptiella gymnastica-like, Strain CCMP1594" /NCGR_SAMPLE_ID=MMETSP0810 /ASSEMBLY_ACC=CAM_ASM_000659 /LENGTH=162 /DNA_ID=CAMNT_0015418001 /DNA_START=117 /DNA_END=604 /DNA_ORIENTATION=+
MVYGMQPARQAPSEQAPHGQATTEQTGWKEPAEPRALPARKACNPPEEAPVGQRALKPKACAPNYALSLFLYTVLYYTTPAVSFGSGGGLAFMVFGGAEQTELRPKGQAHAASGTCPNSRPQRPHCLSEGVLCKPALDAVGAQAQGLAHAHAFCRLMQPQVH